MMGRQRGWKGEKKGEGVKTVAARQLNRATGAWQLFISCRVPEKFTMLQLFVCRLLKRPSNVLVYLRNGSAQTTVRVATLR